MTEPAEGQAASTTPSRRLIGGAVTAFGVCLLLVAAPLTLILFGAAYFQDGQIAATFVLLLGLVPVGLGAWLAHLGRPGFWRRSIQMRDVLRMPGVAGVAILVVTLPLVVVTGQAGIFVALAAMCLYPVLDVPRILTCRSWWRGAIVSVVVWLVVFGALVQTLDDLLHMREDTMVFLLPAMMYPLVLAISGLVRLERRIRGRSAESGARLVVILGATACGLMVGLPVATSMIPVLIEKITGNTVGNTVYSEDATVVSASPGEVTVHLASGGTEPIRFGARTKFDFRGPGSSLVQGTAGPSWLKPGQRIGLEYAYRARKAEAMLLTIWIERKGCADNAKWTAAAATGPAAGTPSLAGTTWQSRGASTDASAPAQTTFEFLAGSSLAYQDKGGTRYTTGAWKQAGSAVLLELNDCYAQYDGEIRGDQIKGEFSNEVGFHEGWTASRVLGTVSATASAP